MPSGFTFTDTDDDGSGLTGTIRNNAWLQSFIAAIMGWAYATFTATWTAATSNPSIGNGTITGYEIAIGKLVFNYVKIVPGSTTTYGSGRYSVSLSHTALEAGAGLVFTRIQDVSAGGAVYNGGGLIETTTKATLFTTDASAAADINATTPITLATGDVLRVVTVFLRA